MNDLAKLTEFLLNNRTIVCVAVAVVIFASVMIMFVSSHIVAKVTARHEEREIARAKKENITELSSIFVTGIFYKLAVKLDNLYRYSRIEKQSRFLNTSIKFWGVTVCTACLGFIAVLIKTMQVIPPFAFGGGVIVFFFGGAYLKCFKNNRKVDKDLMSFINLLGNYSATGTELNALFVQIAPKMHEPLASCLIECVAENQNSEKKSNEALKSLASKLNHPKLREIIKNLEISREFTDNFGIIAEQSRMSVFNYSKGKRQLYEIVRSNTVTMSVCVVVIIGIIFMAGKMLDIDMFHLLFTTFVGQVVLTVTVGCILVFVKKLIEVSG